MTAIIHTESTWRYVLPVSTCTAHRVQETARKCEAHDSFLITKVDHIIFYKLINNHASAPKFTQLRPLNSVEILTANRVRVARTVSLLKAGLERGGYKMWDARVRRRGWSKKTGVDGDVLWL